MQATLVGRGGEDAPFKPLHPGALRRNNTESIQLEVARRRLSKKLVMTPSIVVEGLIVPRDPDGAQAFSVRLDQFSHKDAQGFVDRQPRMGWAPASMSDQVSTQCCDKV